MIKIKRGDLLSVDSGVILHGVNCQGKMTSGVAKSLRLKYPAIYPPYSMSCQDARYKRDLLGTVDSVQVTPQLVVANAFTQLTYGSYGLFVSYDAIDQVMRTLSRKVEIDTPIYMPQIGAKRGGGNWDVIFAIIKAHLDKHDTTIFLFEE